MVSPYITTKLYIPEAKHNAIVRSRLTQRLNEGLHRKLSIISASAGSGKTTLISQWLSSCDRPAAWLSLDERDNDVYRFLGYFAAALQTVDEKLSSYASAALQSPQPPPAESIMALIINDLARLPMRCLLVLDDYHLIHSKPVHDAVAFLLDHLPSNAHLVITSREEPDLPLTRLRMRDEVTELGAADMRFNHQETMDYLTDAMKLQLSLPEISELENRTEGWIAGLQLAALSMNGELNADRFMRPIAGNQRFVMEFLVEEVLKKQSEPIQRFLLYTSILDRLCGPLCEAVMSADASMTGEQFLRSLERANLFVVPLDQEQTWFRYHHLFAETLRQRLQSHAASSADRASIAELHLRASRWYEHNCFPMEAFRHAVAAENLDLAARLAYGDGMPLHLRGEVAPVLSWLETLPVTELDARPSLWVLYASASLMAGKPTDIESKLLAAEAAMKKLGEGGDTHNLIGIIAATRAGVAAMSIASGTAFKEQKLQEAEAALQLSEADDKTNDIIGQISVTGALSTQDVQLAESVIALSGRALLYLNPDILPIRITVTWLKGVAYQLLGDRIKAREAYADVLSISRKLGSNIIGIMANLGQGNLFEGENRLYEAEERYRSALQLAGDLPLPAVCEAHMGLARIHYARNKLENAMQHAEMSAQLAHRLNSADILVSCEIFFARLKLAHRDYVSSADILTKAKRFVRENGLFGKLPTIAAIQVQAMLGLGDPLGALNLAKSQELPLSLARAYLANGDAAAALTSLEQNRHLAEANGREDELLQAMVLEAAALYAQGEKSKAVDIFVIALEIAEQGGYIRMFIDEEQRIAPLLSEANARRILPDYIGIILTACDQEKKRGGERFSLIEPLTTRELEVLHLAAQGLSNRQIGETLFLALDTVKGHHRRIFEKLQVKRRTEAIALARQIGWIK